MAHYAYLDENDIVVDVITGRDEDDTEALPEGVASWEEYYGNQRGLRCLRYSYNTLANTHRGPDGEPDDGIPFRGNAAAVGSQYRDDLDAFVFPQPFPSWTLNPDSLIWEAPVPAPEGMPHPLWDEDSQSWYDDPSMTEP